MKKYIGTKVINAKPMTRQEYNDFRGWELPSDENGSDEGYLVEYVDGGKANTPEYKGYVSWSPKDVFDKAYNEVEQYNGESGVYYVDDRYSAIVGGTETLDSCVAYGTDAVHLNGKILNGLRFFACNRKSKTSDEILDDIKDNSKPSFIYIPRTVTAIDHLIEYLNYLKEHMQK